MNNPVVCELKKVVDNIIKEKNWEFVVSEHNRIDWTALKGVIREYRREHTVLRTEQIHWGGCDESNRA